MKKKIISVTINGIKYVPSIEYSTIFQKELKEVLLKEYDTIINLIQHHIDYGREVSEDFSEHGLKFSHAESEGFVRAAITILEEIKEYKKEHE